MDQQYQSLVEATLLEGNYRPNRTAVDTISTFHQSYRIDVSQGFPLLTTKRMSEFRWNSMIHELLWYFSGEHHIRNLREETKIWDAWADDDWNLPSAYGRFWRAFPVPRAPDHLPGEAWAEPESPWVYETEDDRYVFDQLQHVVDTLNGDHPDRGPESRRLVVTAWHPANAGVSDLPPCHYTFVFNVQRGDTLNLHLTQRSGDVALGIPFNIAAYALLLKIVAQQTGFKVGQFGHTIVDSHIYCGKGDRGEWYADNLDDLRQRVTASDPDYSVIADWIEKTAPDEDESGYDHVPNLLRQLSRDPLDPPTVTIADKPLGALQASDFSLNEYNHHGPLDFEVAE